MAITVERLEAEISADPAKAIAGITVFSKTLDGAARDRTANFDIDTGSAMASLAGLEGEVDVATRDRTINVDIDRNSLSSLTMLGGALPNISHGLSDVASMARTAGSELSSVGEAATQAGGAGGNGLSGLASAAGSAGDSFGTLGKSLGMAAVTFGGMLMVLSVLPGALAAAAAAAGVLVAALAPLLGLLATIPVGLGALGAAVGVLFAGLGGVMTGLKAYTQASKGAVQASEELRSRQEALANAQYSLKKAYESLHDAQVAYAKAPHQAEEHLQDLHFAAAQAILSEKSAILALQQAQENLNNIQNRAAKSSFNLTKQTDEFTGKVYEVAQSSNEAQDAYLQQQQAVLGVQQAELNLAEAKDHTKDTQLELNEAIKKGIKNSDIMVQARRRLRDAEHGVKQAQQAAADAARKLTEAQKGGTAATKAWTQAQKNLSQTGIDFVKFLADEFIPAWHDLTKGVQDALLPGIERGLRSLMTMADEVKGGMVGIGKAMGDSFANFFEYWATPAHKKQLDEMFLGLAHVLDDILKMGIPLSRVFVDITTAAAPLTDILTKELSKALNDFADWLESDRGKKKTQNFFKETYKWIHLWWKFLKPIVGLLTDVTEAAQPLATTVFTDMGDHLADLHKRLQTPQGKQNLMDWFNAQLPTLRELGTLINNIGDLLFNSTQGGEDSSFYKAIKALNEAMPTFKQFFEDLDKSDAAAQFVSMADSLTKMANAMGVIAGFMDSMSGLFKIIGGIGTGMKELDRIFVGTPNRLPAISEWMGKGLTSVKDAVINFTKKGGWCDKHINGDFGGMLRKFASDIGDFFVSIWEGIKTLFDDIKDWLADLPGQIADALNPKNLPKGAGALAGALSDALGNAVGSLVPHKRATGGHVQKGNSYWVGERRPEIFTPETSGRISPVTSPADIPNMTPVMQSKASGYTEADLERILTKVLEKTPKGDITVQTTNETNPLHVAQEVAWSLR